MKKILFTTGGTAGHINPALSLAKKFSDNGYEIIFVGSKTRMEKDLITEYKFYGLDIRPLNSIKGILSQIKSFFHAIKIIKKEKVDIVFGFGNYISLPACIAGFVLRKPLYIQEQNIDFGKANNILRKIAQKVYLAFDATRQKYNLKNKYIVTGNPLREEFYTNDKEQNAILVTGGSLGAKNINEAFLKRHEEFINKGYKVFWATGKEGFENIKQRVLNHENLILSPYFSNMSEYMKKSKIVISRAGALTISEIIALNKVSILIPYDFVGQNENAQMLESINACFKYSNDKVDEAIDLALNLSDEKINEIKENLKKINFGNASDNIYEDIVNGN